MRTLARAAIGTACALLIALAVGFGLFAADASRSSPWPAGADGIVALTGGVQRVETAVALLHAGVAPRLLISGVGQNATLPAVLHNAASDTAGQAIVRQVSTDASGSGAITLGHAARTTAGNAIEIGWWVRANDLHSLVVVTAGYHMRRALFEIGAAIPDVHLTAYAVHPGAGMRTLLIEYCKLIAVRAGLHRTARVSGMT
jgi:uncharacterized SAM-binding protein YcdF (DUF218 family)